MEKKKLRIDIDINDVVFEFVKPLLVHYKKKIGKDILFEDVFTYNFQDVFEIGLDEVIEIIRDLIKEDFNLNMKFCLFAKEIISDLSNNHNIYFITSRVHRENTLESLENHFSDFELHFSFNFYVGTSGKNKGEIYLEKEIDFIVEDSYEYAIICADAGVKVFLIDKPWNQKENLPENIIRVKDWKEIQEKIKEFN